MDSGCARNEKREVLAPVHRFVTAFFSLCHSRAKRRIPVLFVSLSCVIQSRCGEESRSLFLRRGTQDQVRCANSLSLQAGRLAPGLGSCDRAAPGSSNSEPEPAALARRCPEARSQLHPLAMLASSG